MSSKLCSSSTALTGAFIGDSDIWSQALCTPHHGAPLPALFLDRDGVIVVEANYLHEPDKAELIPGAAQAIVQANSLGVPVVIVTNQAGIARGYYGWPAFAKTQEKILADLQSLGAKVDGVYACPHHAQGQDRYRHPSHPDRKPNPGMLLRAAKALNLDLGRSWIIGDRASDLEAGLNAELAGGLHVLTGYGSRKGERKTALNLGSEHFTVLIADSIAKAPCLIPLLSK